MYPWLRVMYAVVVIDVALGAADPVPVEAHSGDRAETRGEGGDQVV